MSVYPERKHFYRKSRWNGSFSSCVNNLKQAPKTGAQKQAPKTGAQKIFLRHTKVRRLKHSLLSPFLRHECKNVDVFCCVTTSNNWAGGDKQTTYSPYFPHARLFPHIFLLKRPKKIHHSESMFSILWNSGQSARISMGFKPRSLRFTGKIRVDYTRTR